MLRTLTHYWRVNLAVGLGAAVATAVLTGALLVGDSVRGSLRALTLERLGRIDHALVAEAFFRESLIEDLQSDPDLAGSVVAPAVVLRGTATHPGTRARSSRVGIHGVDARFTGLFDAGPDPSFERDERQVFPSAVINESLQRELGAEIGDALLLSFSRSSDVPRETLVGETDPDAVLEALRVTLTAVLPDAGLGRFGLTPRQQNPLNAFVSLRQLQRVLGQDGRVNALFVAAGPDAAVPVASEPPSPVAALRRVLRLEDLGLLVERRADHLEVTSREFVLRPLIDDAVGAVASEIGAPMVRVQSYLANSMRSGQRELPYSLVAAFDPRPELPWALLELTDGSAATVPGPRGILLDSWAAEDLAVGAGDPIDVTYFVVGPREELREETESLTVEGVVALRGLAADASLTPDYPGVQEADDMASWDPPFPVDLSRIRPRDEEFWDRYGATPKAFVSEQAGRRLWSTRFGSTNAVRVGVAPDGDPDQAAAALRDGLMRRLSPDAFGLRFVPVKRDGLRAASGATDFSGLFIGFSFFLIVSAALLVGLLFRLGVEQRAGEIGLLLAVGHRVGSVRRRLLLEGGMVAAAGGLIGLAGGVGYAWSLMAGLRTLWRPAVGSSRLFLHVEPLSLALGWSISIAVVLISIFLALRKLVRAAPTSLLAGSWKSPPRREGRLARILAFGGLVGAAALLATAAVTGAIASPGLSFGIGALLLVAGLAFFSIWCRGSRRRALRPGATALVRMAARNSSWNPGRSILSVALVASACFVIVAVAANREEPGAELESRESGAGGFALIAESDIPLHQDLNRAESRFELGFDDTVSAKLEGVEVFPFRVRPGDDASCLNLYRPERPRILGVPEAFARRGGFRFQQSIDPTPTGSGAWGLLGQSLEPGVVAAIADYNSARWILHLGLGQDLTVENDLGDPIRLRLVGLLDGSIFQSELLISERDFLLNFPGRTGDSYFLIDVAAERAIEVAAALETSLGDFGFDATTTRDKLAGYKAVEHTYLSTFQVLGGLGLLLGTVGLGVVLVRNVIERRGELATLRAFGFRRSQLARLVLAENAFLLVSGMVIGTAAAFAAAAPRLAHIQVPWLFLLATLAVVLAIGMLASILAVRGALRAPLLPALKAEH